MTEGGDIKGRKSEARMMLACLQEVLGDVWGRMLGTPMSRYLHCAHTLTLPHSSEAGAVTATLEKQGAESLERQTILSPGSHS